LTQARRWPPDRPGSSGSTVPEKSKYEISTVLRTRMVMRLSIRVHFEGTKWKCCLALRSAKVPTGITSALISATLSTILLSGLCHCWPRPDSPDIGLPRSEIRDKILDKISFLQSPTDAIAYISIYLFLTWYPSFFFQ
jgi:hypothetical protein